MEFKAKIKEIAGIIDTNLDKYLPSEEKYPQTIYKAMRYSTFAGGKRLRPILAYAACEAVGGNVEDVIPFACAIEMTHTYSLIHDDLPAMDDDDYRRGNLTNHKVFGDAVAILAGDALFNSAVELMTKSILEKPSGYLDYLKAMNEIVTASGTQGMIGGQVVDIESEGKQITKDTLHFMHECKTGALITASVRAGAIVGGASKLQLECLTDYSKNLGLAFQIKDDILDIIGDENKLGKKVGSDISNNKSTFPSIYGLEESKEMVVEISQKAVDALNIFKEKGQLLRDIAYYLINRES